jgi:dipeptide/tripeptide permease
VDRLLRFFRSLRGFDRSFWSANVSELFERIAFYGMTTFLVLYLHQSKGLGESTSGVVGGYFGLFTYGLAALSGFLADALGYRRAMLLAYTVLASGYFLVGHIAGTVPILGSLLLVAFGASLIKPSITGTVQKTCTEAQRPLGFSIYYMLVNIGGFLGPNIAGQVRDRAGDTAALTVCAGSAAVALVLVLLAFREPSGPRETKRVTDFLRNFGRVLSDLRFVLLILLVGGFWSMFYQFYVALPLYATNELKLSSGTLGFIVSLDAGMIVALQVVVGYLARNLAASRAVFVAALVASAGIAVIGLHPSVPAVVAGVLVFSVGEMIYSAHFYRYLGSIAPPDQVGMFMGFAFLPIALGYFLAGLIGGPVYIFCRDTLHAPQAMWFVFAGVGLVSAFGMTLLARSRPAAQEGA